MDPRGPPEGAPVNSFEIPNIDKVSDTSVNWSADHSLHSAVCEQPKKMSNKLLFLTVSVYILSSVEKSFIQQTSI